jgi:hypothetical protein
MGRMEIATLHKAFGKIFVKALLLGLLPATQPFYTSSDLRVEPALIGTFGPERANEPVVSEAERETLRISKSKDDPRLYKVYISKVDGTMAFDARLFQLSVSSGAPAYFLDLAPKRDKQHIFTALMSHLAAKIEWKADRIELSFPRQDTIDAAGIDSESSPERTEECKNETERLYAAGSYCSRVLNGATQELQALLRTSLQNGFVAPISLYRIKPAGS